MNPSIVPVMYSFIQVLQTECRLLPGSVGVLFCAEKSLIIFVFFTVAMNLRKMLSMNWFYKMFLLECFLLLNIFSCTFLWAFF